MGYTVKISNKLAHKNAQGFFVISPWENGDCLIEWYTIDHTFSPLSQTFNSAKRKQGGEIIFHEVANQFLGFSQTAIPIFHKYQGDSLQIEIKSNASQIKIKELISNDVFFLERNR
jgi:hypothetical protein